MRGTNERNLVPERITGRVKHNNKNDTNKKSLCEDNPDLEN